MYIVSNILYRRSVCDTIKIANHLRVNFILNPANSKKLSCYEQKKNEKKVNCMLSLEIDLEPQSKGLKENIRGHLGDVCVIDIT